MSTRKLIPSWNKQRQHIPEESTSQDDRSSTPDMPPTTFTKNTTMNTSTWSSEESTEEYNLPLIAEKLDDAFKRCTKQDIPPLYADMIDFIIDAKTKTSDSWITKTRFGIKRLLIKFVYIRHFLSYKFSLSKKGNPESVTSTRWTLGYFCDFQSQK